MSPKEPKKELLDLSTLEKDSLVRISWKWVKFFGIIEDVATKSFQMLHREPNQFYDTVMKHEKKNLVNAKVQIFSERYQESIIKTLKKLKSKNLRILDKEIKKNWSNPNIEELYTILENINYKEKIDQYFKKEK